MALHDFKMALVQMRVCGGELDRNLEHAVTLVARAATHGAALAVLPECLDLGWAHPASGAMADRIPDGKACQMLIRAAQRHSIGICAGLTERLGNHVFNSAVLIDRLGRVCAVHRKINELSFARAYYATGDRLTVARTEFGTIGLLICADAFVEDRVLSRSLGHMGADIILSPCAWAVPAGHDNDQEPYGDLWRESYVPVAREFGMAVIGVSNVGPITAGPWSGRNCIGCSLAVSQRGTEIVQGPYGVDAECILYITGADGDLQYAH